MGRLKQLTSKIFTLSYSEYRLVIFSFVLFLLWILPFGFLETIPNLSICSRIFGSYCFSAGITRGVSLLLKGEFNQAMNYNFLSVLVLAVLVLFILHDFAKLIKEKSQLIKAVKKQSKKKK